MDPATIFVLCITACIVGILAYLKLRGTERLPEPGSEGAEESPDDIPREPYRARKKRQT